MIDICDERDLELPLYIYSIGGPTDRCMLAIAALRMPRDMIPVTIVGPQKVYPVPQNSSV